MGGIRRTISILKRIRRQLANLIGPGVARQPCVRVQVMVGTADKTRRPHVYWGKILKELRDWVEWEEITGRPGVNKGLGV